jgi:hypothetical protein
VQVPFASRAARSDEREPIRAFLRSLPVALESQELRIVHAAWHPPAIELARRATSLDHFIQAIPIDTPTADFDGAPTPQALVARSVPVSFHAGLAAQQVAQQNSQPIKVLTSGLERPIRPGTTPRWLSGKWRLQERDPWWEHDDDPREVVFGHYWRRRPHAEVEEKPEAFGRSEPTAWFGKQGRAFCVDYSAGYRFKARHAGDDPHRNYGLAALRWPERVLIFDDLDAPVRTSGPRD